MRTLLRTALSFLLILSPALCRAENVVVEHNFHELSASHIKFSKNAAGKANGVAAIDDGVTYTCAGEAQFGMDRVSGIKIALNLNDDTGAVTTTRFEDLTKITLWFYPDDKTRENIKIQLSTDGTVWGDDLSEGVTYMPGQIEATFPRGDYYVRIHNTSNTKYVSILQTRFTSTTDDCNCFVYTP